ncbi:hypothetical protein CYANOKiyG1_55230 [Okeania sp. KiyG1]|nr:hypothetical protein CYANOKiyG1_55230 [Okeania sp. KiyG1]
MSPREDGNTAKALKRQGYKCGHCGHYLDGNERVHLHHIDGNHDNWKPKNLLAVHESCHDYIHMGMQAKSLRLSRSRFGGESRTSGSEGEVRGIIPSIDSNNHSSFKGANRPVEWVTWNDATEFCQKLSEITGKKYSLPSESQWEYARPCRNNYTILFWGNYND